MDIELQRHYEDKFEMMSTRGWLDFIEEMTAILETTNQLNTVKNEQELYLAKGEMNILSLIINWQAASEATWRDLNENTN
jgi:hypothetical protein